MRKFSLLVLILLTACAAMDVTPAPVSTPGAAGLPAVSVDAAPIAAESASVVEGSAGTFRLTIHPDLAEYTFKLESNPDPYRLMDRHFMVGWIEVTGANEVLQKLPVSFVSADSAADWPQLGLRALDVNFDGYLDIAAVEPGGAAREYWRWFVFQPETGVFKVTALADDLSARPHNGVAADPAAKQIYLYTLTEMCPGTFVYDVTADYLILVAKTELHPAETGCEPVP